MVILFNTFGVVKRIFYLFPALHAGLFKFKPFGLAEQQLFTIHNSVPNDCLVCQSNRKH
jgi:hypothetical protein